MTDRLYYTDSFMNDFDARVVGFAERDGRTAVVLDRTAFYPTSGGQIFDTGWLVVEPHEARLKIRVCEVVETENGQILHFIDPVPGLVVGPGIEVRGLVDVARRRDHMQQHSGQHVLSAAFLQLFNMPTVSFHMGDEACTIDLEARGLRDEQLIAVEDEANRIVMENRPVEIRFASVDDARAMGVRKLPPDVRGELRLIDIFDYDLNACGGTHVQSTGQIGPIQLRKTEKVRQGIRVEFVCGERAISTARRDFTTLTEAASAYSTGLQEVPGQIRKTLEDVRAAQKERKRLLEELAELHAERMLAQTAEQKGIKLVVKMFPDRDISFIKLLAQKITAAPGAVALLATNEGQPGLVFAQSEGGPFDVGALMKDAMTASGGRGGGTRDMAQGGAPVGVQLEAVLEKEHSTLIAQLSS